MTVVPPETPDPDLWLIVGVILLSLLLGSIALILFAHQAPCLHEAGGLVCF
jgi:hypothetical protein